MSIYNPDSWAIVEFKTPKETIYKVLASWYGGYMNGDSWKLSSGVTEVVTNSAGDVYSFHNVSGSVYVCPKNSAHMSGIMGGVYTGFQNEIERLNEALNAAAAEPSPHPLPVYTIRLVTVADIVPIV